MLAVGITTLCLRANYHLFVTAQKSCISEYRRINVTRRKFHMKLDIANLKPQSYCFTQFPWCLMQLNPSPNRQPQCLQTCDYKSETTNPKLSTTSAHKSKFIKRTCSHFISHILQLELCTKPVRQYLQTWDFVLSWTAFLCLAKIKFWVNSLEHTRQVYFPFFSWTVWMWRFKLLCRLKSLRQDW